MIIMSNAMQRAEDFVLERALVSCSKWTSLQAYMIGHTHFPLIHSIWSVKLPSQMEVQELHASTVACRKGGS